MFDSILGLPLHPLVVHAVVVLVPLAALGGLAVAVIPPSRRRYAPIAFALATIALIAVPVATQTGEAFQTHIKTTPLVDRHTELAGGLLPWVIGLWVGLAILLSLSYTSRRGGVGMVVRILASIAIVVAGAGSAAEVAIIGHSGSQAVWNGVVSGPSGAGAAHR